MKTSSVSLLLGVCVVLLSALTVSAVSLTVSPNLQQFFTGASVSLTCEGQLGSDGWTVKRDTGSGTESCGAGGRGFGRINGASCFFDEFKPVSGVYWCEGEAGEKSEEVNITVSGNEVIHLIIRLTAHCYTTSTSLCVSFLQRGLYPAFPCTLSSSLNGGRCPVSPSYLEQLGLRLSLQPYQFLSVRPSKAQSTFAPWLVSNYFLCLSLLLG
ncbi:uncharacterized protein LOC109196952 [Oreochromis niloticus]|uniref:uncharacterized protein LOC109196952 n=1 Tax=Oreochromis niloticus TaxID=8128 RepID=UPI000DF30D98|nr:uncharacterized protein LOC109196952 [Oreochromis niloticus]